VQGSEALSSMEAQLAAVPHASLLAGEPGTLSRSYMLLVSQAGQVATARTGSELETGAVRTP
jgi:hypothetical protein